LRLVKEAEPTAHLAGGRPADRDRGSQHLASSGAVAVSPRRSNEYLAGAPLPIGPGAADVAGRRLADGGLAGGGDADGRLAAQRSPAVPATKGRSPGRARTTTDARPAPLRLTRRGRVVVAVLGLIAALAISGLLWLAVAGQAQASSHVQPGRPGGSGMIRVVVQPGQTLWSIAVRAEPSADPRVVIQEITDANLLSSPAIHAGEVLWVPHG